VPGVAASVEKAYQADQQQVRRIEGIVQPPKSFIVGTLLAAVQPDGDQRQHGQSLPHQEEGVAEQMDLIGKAAEDLNVDIGQQQRLTQEAPPFSAPEEIEYQDHQKAAIEVIHHGQQTQNVGKAYGDKPHQNSAQALAAEPRLFIHVDQEDAQQEGKQDILVERIDQRAARYQIERQF